MIGSTLVGEMERRTNNRFRKVYDFETYITAIDVYLR